MSSGTSTSNSTHQRHAASATAASASAADSTSITGGNNNHTSPSRSRQAGRNMSPLNMVAILLGKVTLVISIFLRVLLWPVAKLSVFLFPAKESDGLTNVRSLDKAARLFYNHFQALVQQHASTSATGDVVSYNPFEQTCYQKCLTQAERSQQALLLYIHSPLHPKSDDFLKKYLIQHPATMQFLQQSQPNLLACGVSVHSAEGEFLAKQQWGATEFPFLVLVGCRSSGSSNRNATVELLLKMEGTPLSPEELHTNLMFALNRHTASIAQTEARRLQREEETLLRQEQDREYQEALQLDRDREAQRRQEEEERQAEEKRQQEAVLAEENVKRLKIQLAQSLLAGGEPDASLPRTELSNIRITLPSGTRLQRRFRAEETVSHLRAFLVMYFNDLGEQQTSTKPAHVIEHFSISTNYPRRTFHDAPEDNSLTLKDAGLVPQAVLMVQDLDA